LRIRKEAFIYLTPCILPQKEEKKEELLYPSFFLTNINSEAGQALDH